MTDTEFKKRLTELHRTYMNEKYDVTMLIAQAVQLGMQYREEQIREGINIVFNTLHIKSSEVKK